MLQELTNKGGEIQPLRAIELEIEELLASSRLLNELAYALEALLDEAAQKKFKDVEFKLSNKITLLPNKETLQLVLTKEQIMLAKESETASNARKLASELKEHSQTRLSLTMYKQILTYYLLRSIYNWKLNLSRIEESDLIVETDIRDCFYLVDKLKELPMGTAKVLDIGTGAGVPGFLLTILLPTYKYTLLDTVQKKLAFLDIVKKQLKIKNCELVWSRVEDYARSKARHSFDFVISRAVSPLATLLEYSLPLTKIAGHCLCLKTTLEEQTDANKLFNLLGAEQLASFVYPEAANLREHLILVFRQIKAVKVDFPRPFNLPRTESLDII